MIYTINTFNNSPNYKNNKSCVIENKVNHELNFGNKNAILKTKKLENLEKQQHKVEFFFRKLIGKINVALNGKKIDSTYKSIANLDVQSLEYMENSFNYGKMMARGKKVEINIEDGALANIAKSDEPCIFIMNHDNQRQDPKLLAVFNSLLTREYVAIGKGESSPRPKIILNEDIITSANEKTGAIYEKLGAVGVDASLFSPNLVKNGKKIFLMIKEFIANKANIYIFPEGKMCAFKYLDPEYKFQTGVADIVSQITKRKKQVKVVPLGFAYEGKIGSIHIGEPIYFKKDGAHMLTTSGSVNSSFASKSYVDFFKNSKEADDFRVITDHGKPVEDENISDYIAGVLCENLKICKSEAKKAISPTPTEKVPEFNIELYDEG